MYTEYDNEGNYTQETEKPDRRKLYLIIIIILLLLFFGWLFFFSGWI
jgi:flagellar basal body-associated protein FliL